MPTTIKCPACTRALEVPDQLMGKRVKCPACKMIFTATPAGKGPPPDPRAGRQSPDSKSEASVRRGSPKPPPFEIEEEDEDQPRVRKKAVRRRGEEDEEDEEYEDEEDEEEEEEIRPRRR